MGFLSDLGRGARREGRKNRDVLENIGRSGRDRPLENLFTLGLRTMTVEPFKGVKSELKGEDKPEAAAADLAGQRDEQVRSASFAADAARRRAARRRLSSSTVLTQPLGVSGQSLGAASVLG